MFLVRKGLKQSHIIIRKGNILNHRSVTQARHLESSSEMILRAVAED